MRTSGSFVFEHHHTTASVKDRMDARPPKQNVKLVAEEAMSEEFELLRPISILASSSKWFSRICLDIAQEVDVGTTGTGSADNCVLGFRKGYQCAELVNATRESVKRCTGWDLPLCICQLDFAQAYDSLRHEAVWNAMHRRGVPVPVRTRHMRDMRSVELVFVHRGWKTKPVAPTVGVRQGCSLSALVSRCCIQDAVTEARKEWDSNGQGHAVDERLLQVLAWADNLYLFAGSRGYLESMIASIMTHALRHVGLHLRVEVWMHKSGEERQDTAKTGGRPSAIVRRDATDPKLILYEGPWYRQAGRRRPRGGIPPRCGDGVEKLLPKKPLWLANGRAQNKVQALHLAVCPAVSWSGGTRHWTLLLLLRQLRSMHIRMTRRIAVWWPHAEEDWAAYARRTARHEESLWRDAKMTRGA